MREVRLTRDLDDDAAASALRFVMAGRRSDSDALGFIPRAGVLRHHRTGKLAVLLLDGELAGFSLFGGSNHVGKIFQLWVPRDARRIEHGRLLTNVCGGLCHLRGLPILRAKVAADLPAVSFWRALGFREKEVAPGGMRRGRLVVTFERESLSETREPRAAAYELANAPALSTPQQILPTRGLRA